MTSNLSYPDLSYYREPILFLLKIWNFPHGFSSIFKIYFAFTSYSALLIKLR